MEPDDLVPAKTIAEWTDLNERQVRKLAEAGHIERDGQGQYRFRATVRAIVIRSREQAAGRLGLDEADKPDLQHERALLARSQRQGQIMRNAILRAELIPSDVMLDVFSATLASLRTRLLELPSQVAMRLVGVKTAGQAQAIVEDAASRLLIAASEDEAVGLGEEVKRRAKLTTGSRADLADPNEVADA